MCNLFLAMAVTIHFTFVQVDDLNYYHPHTGVECNNIIGGVYYNSEWKISPYVGMKFDISDNQRIEAGFVANYATSPVIPWVRYVNRIFFIAPGIVSKTTDYVFNGELFESTTSYYASTVIGIELRKNILNDILSIF